MGLPVRYIQVVDTRPVTPHLLRVSFTCPNTPIGTEPDQQVKLYFPRPGQTVPTLPEPGDDFNGWYAAFAAIPEPQRPWMRGYTLRASRPGEIDIDFVLHPEAGPATDWARAAKPGDTLGMFGPSDYFGRPVPISRTIAEADWLLLAGDATAIPGIATLLASLPVGHHAVVHVSGEPIAFDTEGDVTVNWVDDPVAALAAAEFPTGTVFAWLAGEAGMVRALRRHLVDVRGIPKHTIDFAGYWRAELTQDDPPTPEDLADAQELVARTFDEAYESHTAPWVIDGPQPVVVELEQAGLIRGTVLDAGCGLGEHTIFLSQQGYDVLGIDWSEVGIRQARENAASKAVAARFEVADALNLPDGPTYDTVLDCGLFHNFSPADREKYVAGLRRVCRPGALVHVHALSDEGPGIGPVISDEAIRAAFAVGWVLESLVRHRYQGNGMELPAWLARLRRT